MRTANPALNDNVFVEASRAGSGGRVMTINGTVTCTAIFLSLTFLAAMFTWNLFIAGSSLTMWLMYGGMIGGFILALVTVFKPQWAMITGSMYAVAEGFFLGGLSSWIQSQFMEPIVLQAVGLTFGTLFGLLLIYRTGVIKVTQNFRLGVAAATMGIVFVYGITFLLSMFGVTVPYIHDASPIGIGISLFVIVVAALNLVLDFDFIENGAKMGAPKYMEWYAAFGLLVTLVWLYIEILRLLSKLNSRN